ncbi:radical SAM domain-containing protein [Methanocaldococcus villosus KIN24-T80]|uniref:7-carboxy-7-deazaguanine synthase n=1 Tax=Methanocaldococcus villosus KIN24-T80 TaxID=1069083 RepID=N6V013_9EURY|nr:7-carboxy-7-deazaguanine synthase QueE [Methanocaldococcus villosus]ENN95628.1 radical SAM domain-containing protein [Methanocaldococcus villosus KIN24-T80]
MIREIFNSIMGEGKYIGRRFIFVRFAGCPLECIYCDENIKNYLNRVEKTPGSGDFIEEELGLEEIVYHIKRLKTPDVFAISFTGGEPLLYHKEIRKIVSNLDEITFLETNGIFPNRVFYFDIASVDIKLREHFNDIKNYNKIYRNELKTIKKFYNMGSDVYAKVVILKNTKLERLREVAKDLCDIGDITLCIQPVFNKDLKPSNKKLFEILKICGEYVDVMLTVQMHKYMGVL